MDSRSPVKWGWISDVTPLLCIARDQGDLTAALRYGQESLESTLRHFGEDHHNTAAAHDNLGLVLADAGRLDEAEAHFRRALEVSGRAGTFVGGAIIRTHLGILLAKNDRAEEGVALCREGLELMRQHLPENQLEIARALRGLGLALETTRADEAVEPLRAALEIYREACPESPALCSTAAVLSRACRESGRLEESVDSMQESVEFTLRYPSSGTGLDLIPRLEILLDVAAAADRPVVAERAARELIAREGRRLQWLGALAKALNRQGRFPEAVPLARESCGLADELVDQSLWIAAHTVLGATLLGAGELEEAEERLLAAHETLAHVTPPGATRGRVPPPLAELRAELHASLVELYQRLDEPEEVEYWRKLAEG